ncbi:MAG TPA: TonB family protein [Vicinamibacterales bacterium]|nr:TonB family protein [Vicinamibacterales bacterium]
MTRSLVRMARLTLVPATLTLVVATSVAAQDSMNAARDLYASAAYEDALTVLNRLEKSSRAGDESRTIEQYRAFCLLALGRTSEAEHAIEVIISGEPGYMPADSEVSPRVRAAFADVRRRMLPVLIQQAYTQAKAAYDRKEYSAAATAFNQLLEEMGDPDLRAAAGQPPLSDLKTLAVGFRDLSVTAATPPAPALSAKPSAPPAAVAQAAEVAPVAVPEPVPTKPGLRIYTLGDSSVVPPVPLQQDLPPYRGNVLIPKQGLIEVVIDETGGVESATMRASVSSAYDAAAMTAARAWHYKPAMLNGAPVKYRKIIQISVKQGTR